ncbi:MAG: hypothetical protein IPG33_11475 [Betaproteobacteria bacterium]|nr:hypothetical protein [Betaproteobacteria bacterium]
MAESATDRLTVENQPTSEGAYRLKGELHHSKDQACGFELTENFERFNQANDIYTRGQWDARIRSDKVINWFKGMFRPGLGARKAEGYSVRDFALRNAGWMGANLTIQRSLKQGRVDAFLDYILPYSDPNPEKIEIESPEVMSEEMKALAGCSERMPSASPIPTCDGITLKVFRPRRWPRNRTGFLTVCRTSS